MPDNTRTSWPELVFENYKDTVATVHLWTQIIGKIRLKKMPWLNHSWHVTLYVSARGLTTGSMPYDQGVFQIDLDCIDHQVIIASSNGKRESIKLYPRTVASFYNELFSTLDAMDIDGRKAPEYTGAVPNIPQAVMQEAYSHEVSSAGFWPGGETSPSPIFYSYCYPSPADFGKQPVAPAAAFYSTEMGEFILPYDAVQQSKDPAATLLQFLRSTYDAAAITGNWSNHLECNLTRLEK